MKRFSEVKPEDFLKTPKQRAIYINAAIEDDDQKMLKIALEDVAKAVGITDTTKEPTSSKEDFCNALNKKTAVLTLKHSKKF